MNVKQLKQLLNSIPTKYDKLPVAQMIYSSDSESVLLFNTFKVISRDCDGKKFVVLYDPEHEQ